MTDNATENSQGNDQNELFDARRDYTADQLRRKQLSSDPLVQFTRWLADARAAKLIDATAMHLATVDASGHPHSRIVLLKQFAEYGYVFYTSYDSDKGQQLAANPHACLLFYWQKLERQVRIEGTVTAFSAQAAEAYFKSRPEGSRFSAAASAQSQPVTDRAVLQQQVAALHTRYPDGDVPRPENWGGYVLQPDYYEFWQGRSDRLHDRFRFRQTADGWDTDRLAP